MMITSKQFLSLYILFLQNLLNPDHVTSHVKSILIEEWLSMIFPENNLATEECGWSYKSSCKKKMPFCGRIIQICQPNEIEIVWLKHKYWGNSFLICIFPMFFLHPSRNIHWNRGHFHVIQSVSIHYTGFPLNLFLPI